jgi:predicted metal-dependent hydrolase
MHSSSASRTPQNVEIVPRNQHFNVEEVLQTNWHGDDPFKTAFFDAMSILFPLVLHRQCESLSRQVR